MGNAINGWAPWLGINTSAPDINSPELQPGELMGAGVEIPKGDFRLKQGINLNNLTPMELQKLQEYRKRQQQGR